MSLSSCLRKAGNLINKDDRLAIMSTAKNLRASGLDADEAGLQAITRQTEVVRAAIKAITGRDEPVRQLVAKPGADKPRGIDFDTKINPAQDAAYNQRIDALKELIACLGK